MFVKAAAAAANRKGKRSALVDHHMKNKQHRSLMAEMDKQLRKVTIVSGMAQRLTNKVAIVTGVPGFQCLPSSTAGLMDHMVRPADDDMSSLATCHAQVVQRASAMRARRAWATRARRW